MDFHKLIETAVKLDLPDLAARGRLLLSEAVQFADLVKTNAARARHVLSEGDRAEIDAIHAEALAAADALDAKLAAAGQR